MRLACLHLILILPESDSAFMFELCGALSKSEVPAKYLRRRDRSYQEEGTRFKRCMLAKKVYAATSSAATNLNRSDNINLEEIIKDAN